MSSAPALTTAQFGIDNPVIYYAVNSVYVLAMSKIISICRIALSIIFIVQFLVYGARYRQVAKALEEGTYVDTSSEKVKKWVKFKTVDEMRAFWWGQLGRGLSELLIPVVAPLLWSYRDIIYVRPDKSERDEVNPYNEPFQSNLLGMDEINFATAWKAEMDIWARDNLKSIEVPKVTAPPRALEIAMSFLPASD